MHGGEPGNYLNFLLDYFPDFSDLSGYSGSFTPAHLWFILYLFVFSLIALPLFRWLVQHHNRASVRDATRWFSHSPLFLALFIPLTALQALPAPGGLNPFYYFFIYVAGFLVCMQPNVADMLARCRLPALLALLFTVPVWLWMLYRFRGIGYGSKLLNIRHPWLNYANEAAFPIYIIHQTVVVAIGYYVIQLNWNLYVKYIVILVLSFAVSCMLYEGVIRRIAVLRWMFGISRR